MTMASVPKVLDSQSNSTAGEEMTQTVTAEKGANAVELSGSISHLQMTSKILVGKIRQSGASSLALVSSRY